MNRARPRTRYFAALAGLLAANVAVAALLLRPAERAPAPRPAPSEFAHRAAEAVHLPEPLPLTPTELRGPRAAPVALLPTFETARPPALAPAPRERKLGYETSAITAVVRANGGRVPANGRELRDALEQLGDFVQLPVPFSAVALDSGLSRPRVVITQRPNTRPTTAANRPNLEGRLFLAANTADDGPDGRPRVHTVEFISWNTRTLKFDFGVIEGFGTAPELKMLDGVRCISCHKNRGPILGVAPWSNTAHNGVVWSAALTRYSRVEEIPEPAESNGGRKRFDVDGLTLLTPSAAEVDAAVRIGADLPRDREVFKALTRTAAGRRAFAVLLTALAADAPFEAADARADAVLGPFDRVNFATAVTALRRATPTGRLHDFDPVAQLERRQQMFPAPGSGLGGMPGGGFGGGGWGGGWGGTSSQDVTDYDGARAHGKHGLGGSNLPSNPAAFQTFTVPAQFSQAAGAALLARTIGLTDPDRRFLIDTLAGSAADASRWTNRAVSAGELAAKVFGGSAFADVFAGGELPDRDDFKDRFAGGLVQALRGYGYAVSRGFWIDRDRYASGPKRGTVAKEAAEVVPTTACLRCHDVRGATKAAFSPIPPLAFDPFDPAGREAWVRSADPTKRAEVLARLMKRMGTDQDMPPADSAEHKLFRVKDAAAFDSATRFLDAELRRPRGE